MRRVFLEIETEVAGCKSKTRLAQVEVATSAWERGWGLLGRSRLAADQGLWIKPCRGVHTLFMRFAIDIVALDSAQRVLRIWPRLAPWRLTSVYRRSASVLELAAGRAEACRLQVGDRIEVVELERK